MGSTSPRQPGNAIGWVYLAVGLLGALQALAAPYATFSLVDRPGSLPDGLAMGWLIVSLRYIWNLVFLFVPLLFPTGRPLSPGWRPVVWLAAALSAGAGVTAAITPGPMSTTPVLPDNPLGIRPAAVILQHVTTVLVLGIAALAVVAAVSVVIRYRRARGVERQQLKWLAYTVGLFAVVFALAATGPWDWWVPHRCRILSSASCL